MIKKKILLIFLIFCSLSFAVQYTNKKTVSVQGKADPFVEVKIFNNNKQLMTVNSNENGLWLATDIDVSSGDNEIYAKAFDQFGNESKFSKRIKIIVDTDAPKILKFDLNKNTYKPGEKLKIKVVASEDTQAAIVTMPDSSLLDLQKQGLKNFVGEWTVDEAVSEGQYNLALSITDRAGNIAQEYSNYFKIINNIGNLEIVSPSNNTVVYQKEIVLKGIAAEAQEVAVNDNEKIKVNSDGTFGIAYQKLLLGKNLLRIYAFHGKKSIYKDINIIRLITFPDIEQHPFRREIEYLATIGRIQAYAGDQFFKPQAEISRAEVIATLVKDLASEYQIIDSGSGSFLDIPMNYWAGNDIMLAAKNNLIIGYPDKSFKPKNIITRAEMATLIARFVHLPITNGGVSYQDVSQKSWAKNYIAAFAASGLMPPNWNGNYFYPNQIVSRAEFCYILARVSFIKKQLEEFLGISINFSENNFVSQSFFSQVDNQNQTDRIKQMQQEQLMRQEISTTTVAKNYYSPPPPQNTSSVQSLNDNLNTVNAPRSIYSVEVFPKSIAAGEQLNVILFLIEDIEGAYLNGIKQEKINFIKSANNKYSASYYIPNDIDSGSYFVDIVVRESNGRIASLRSESFVIRSLRPAPNRKVEKKVLEQTATLQNQNEQTPQFGIIYPEEFDRGNVYYQQPQQTSLQNSSNKLLSRAELVRLLAENNYLKKSTVNGPVADDVLSSHPQAGYIKTAIITEKIPNLNPGKFKPNDPVSRAYAATVLCKVAKLDVRMATTAPAYDVSLEHWAVDQINTLKSLGIIDSKNFRPSEQITEADFKFWLKKVKK